MALSTHVYIRNKNAVHAPFHFWHKVSEYNSDGGVYVTACGLMFSDSFGFYDAAYLDYNGGAHCQTNACKRDKE